MLSRVFYKISITVSLLQQPFHRGYTSHATLNTLVGLYSAGYDLKTYCTKIGRPLGAVQRDKEWQPALGIMLCPPWACARRASLPRLCILVIAALAAIVMIDMVPRMVIVATEPRETSYWEAWEEAYMNRWIPPSSAYP